MKKMITQQQFLNTAVYKKSIFDFCANYYRLYIKNALDNEIALKNFILLLKWNGDSDETLEIPEIISKMEYQDVIKNIAPMTKKIIGNIVTDNLEESDFYAKVWETISNDVLFATELEKICAIVLFVLDPRIPYFKLGQPLKMENDKYREISESLYEKILKSYFVLQYGYAQKTELASQLYSIVQELENKEEKIVLIANILGWFTSQLKILSDKVISKDISDEDGD